MKNWWLNRNEHKNHNEQHHQVTDYVLLMLGAPVIKIEMDEQQLDFCAEQAERVIIAYEADPQKQADLTKEMRLELQKEVALIYANYMLGQIRSMFKVPGDDRAERMKLQAKRDLDEWKKNLTWALDYPD